ncbi:DUF805 domain-containing protein [Candidatus Uhrbacteria bacterium]|nr:DUF805 domain-containing protein [Candidatus Uhrbacteria bacterium]
MFINGGILILLSIADEQLNLVQASVTLTAIYTLVLLLPMMSITVRRLHDSNHSGC